MFVIIFFFQAEDGIRDPLVTGVQTCALPILPAGHPACLTRRLIFGHVPTAVSQQDSRKTISGGLRSYRAWHSRWRTERRGVQDDGNDRPSADREKHVRAVIGGWRDSLIDLTGSSRLLNLK